MTGSAEQAAGPPSAGGAGHAEQALAYLSGDPDARLDAGRLRQLVEALVTGPASLFERALALVLLQTATDAEVGQMIVGGGLAGVLDAAFPAGEGPAGRLRDDLQRFYEQRFGVGQQEAVAAGTAPPLEVYPAGVFSPGQVEERLTSQLLAAGLTPDQARAALYNRRDASLKQLPADPRQIPAPPASYDARQAPTGPVLTGNSADLMSGLDQVPSAGAEIVGLLQPDRAQDRVVAARGLQVIPVSPGEDSLMSALIVSAPEAFG